MPRLSKERMKELKERINESPTELIKEFGVSRGRIYQIRTEISNDIVYNGKPKPEKMSYASIMESAPDLTHEENKKLYLDDIEKKTKSIKQLAKLYDDPRLSPSEAKGLFDISKTKVSFDGGPTSNFTYQNEPLSFDSLYEKIYDPQYDDIESFKLLRDLLNVKGKHKKINKTRVIRLMQYFVNVVNA